MIYNRKYHWTVRRDVQSGDPWVYVLPFFRSIFFWIDQNGILLDAKECPKTPRFISDLFITLPRNKNTDTNYLLLFYAGYESFRKNEVIQAL